MLYSSKKTSWSGQYFFKGHKHANAIGINCLEDMHTRLAVAGCATSSSPLSSPESLSVCLFCAGRRARARGIDSDVPHPPLAPPAPPAFSGRRSQRGGAESDPQRPFFALLHTSQRPPGIGPPPCNIVGTYHDCTYRQQRHTIHPNAPTGPSMMLQS